MTICNDNKIDEMLNLKELLLQQQQHLNDRATFLPEKNPRIYMTTKKWHMKFIKRLLVTCVNKIERAQF